MLHEIEHPIAAQMQQFDQRFKAEIRSQVTLLDMVMSYILRKKGKRLRPILVFLCAGLYGSIEERSYRAAMLIELLHTATLLHDDVVDRASERRGLFSVNSIWKNKVSVLAGDFLLSRGLLIAMRHQDYDLLEIVTHTVEEMSQGELLQVQKTTKLNIQYEEYLQIIKKKTASLLAGCCQLGASSVGASIQEIERMKQLGYQLGIAFQMRDDLFDYEENGPAGKSFGLDIQEKNLTLPILYALNKASPLQRSSIRSLLKRKRYSLGARRKIVKFVRTQGGLTYTRNLMEQYTSEAMRILKDLEPSVYKSALLHLVEFTTQRRR